MTKQEKIDKIYKEIANKEFSFWCKYRDTMDSKVVYIEKDKLYPHWRLDWDNVFYEWHPVMIWDVLDYIVENQLWWAEYQWACDKWSKLRKPIEEQSEECISFIYNLLPKT